MFHISKKKKIVDDFLLKSSKQEQKCQKSQCIKIYQCLLLKFKNSAQSLSVMEVNEYKLNKNSFQDVSYFEKKKIFDDFLHKSSK